jgi:pimeloyl-ACP methyl ester carboxylesterase
MTVDVATLESLSSYDDPSSGIRERFLKLRAGGAATIAVLSEPIADPIPFGWVLCHSFGLEQLYLQSMETPIVRQLSAAGFPVLRFHAQGYGDSELPVDQVSLDSHVRDAVDAVKELVDVTGVPRVGLMGARFGGTVAALAADRVDAAAMILWHPIVSGRSFLDSLLRRSALSGLASAANGAAIRPDDPDQGPNADGIVELQGWPITGDAYEAFRSMNLISDLRTFGGSSLIVQISSTDGVDEEFGHLTTRLRDRGGASDLQVIVHKRARGFGMPRFRPNGLEKIDTQADLLEDLAARTLAWVTTHPSIPSKDTVEERQ